MAKVYDCNLDAKVTVNVGDTVSFKSDMEQCGVITQINGAHIVVRSSNDEGFIGCYLQGQTTTTLYTGDCYLD